MVKLFVNSSYHTNLKNNSIHSRMTFGVDPDTHIDSLEQAEHATVEGTSKWSYKLTITGTHRQCHWVLAIYFFNLCIRQLLKFLTMLLKS